MTPDATNRRQAAAGLADLAARRDSLADHVPATRLRETIILATVVGAGLALGALHNTAVNVIALPAVFYALARLTGAGQWQRAGIVPRRPPGFVAAVQGTALILAAPAGLMTAYVLDDRGIGWALPVGAVVVPLLAVAARRGINKLRRAGLRR